MRYPSEYQGWLKIRVDRETSRAGIVKVTLELERVDRCENDHCRSAWIKTFKISSDTFRLDKDLKNASLSVRVMSRLMTASWRAGGQRTTRHNFQRMKLFDQQDAFGTSSFGSVSSDWESKPDSGLFRTVPD